MSVCVNTKSKEFKDAVDRLNISQGSLENIVHEYINAEGNVDSFPSDSYILSKIEGEPFTEELSEKAQKLIELKYSKPIIADSYADAQAVMRDISQYFDSRHIGLKETKDGKFEVSIAKVNTDKSKTPLKEQHQRKDLWDWARFAPNEKYNSSSSKSVRYNKNLQDGKVLDNFLNTDIGSKYIEKIGSSYRLKRGRLGYTEALDTLNFYLKTRELPSDYIGVTRDGYLYERTKAYPLKDQIEAYKNSEDLFENATQQEQALQILDFLKEKTGLNFKFISLKEAQEKLKGKDLSDVNSFVIGNTAYFINDGGRVFNTDIAAEEMLHPFVASIRAMNSKAFYSLLKDARRAFPVLSRQIEHSYKSDVPEEIVTQALSRAFRKDFEEHPNHRAIRDLMVKFWNYVKGWFRNSGDIPIFNNVDKLYAEDLSETITIQNLAEIINTEISLGNANNINRVAFNRENTENSQINIYAGTGENSELSNFAERPFTTASPLTGEPVQFSTVEGAFQAHKLEYTDLSAGEIANIESKLMRASGSEARALGRQIKGLDTKAWDSESSQIMKDLIKASFEQNPEALQKLLDTGDAILTHTQDRSKWRTEFPRILMEVREELRNEQFAITQNGLSVPQEQVRPELSQFQNETTKVVAQLNKLLNSDLISNSEVRHIAEQTVYYISDIITEFLENPETLFNVFPELAVRDGKSITDKERAEEIKKIQQMSRAELVKYITPQRLMEFTKNRLFTPQGNNNLNTRQLIKKARLIEDNFDTIIKFASDTFSLIEDFAITTADNELTVNENLSPLNDDFNNTYDTDIILENEGNLQEHWQIERRTIDVLSSMSRLVKAALNKCYLLRVNPETGKLEKVPSEFGIAERVNVKDATSSILRWTQGAESLSHMVQLLEAKAKDNPWITQIIDRLKDTSGKESDFQSQFYGVFAKAFQPYSIVLRERDEKTGQFVYKSISVNQHPALRDATQAIKVAYKTNMHPLFDGGKVKTDALEALRGVVDTLVERAQNKLEENDRAEIIDLIFKAATALGHDTDVNLINLALDSTSTFQSMVNNLKSIVDNLSKSTTIENYDPFKFEDKNNISRFLNRFLKPLTDKLEDTAVSSFYDSGKMYQSYVTPSYLTVMMNHFHGENATFQEWLQNEYGAYEWFVNPDGSWRNVWLETLDGKSQEDRKDLFRHKVQLNFNKHNYMKNMSDVEYALSILSEYFSEFAKAKGVTVPVWYRVPMMSNKPSSEFIRMNAYTGKPMKTRLIEGFSRIFQQELSRIQTVDIRGYDKSNPNFIKNFDKNGKKFMMLSFFNKYLEGGKEANSELGKLINKSIKEGTGKLTLDEQARMSELVDEEILTSMDNIADNVIAEWKSQGIFEGAKQIANIGKEDDVVEEKLREFIWNDTFASMNILELTITDPAYYKDAEDLQKRLAQIHAPGTRANIEALDYEGKRVTDGKFRTVLLKDFDDFVSNIKDNLRIVFDRKLKELENEGVSKEDSRYKAAAATYENIINQFDNINVADAQGYSSPTSYRKKAFIFGKWSRKSEDIYQKLKAGNYNYSDLQTAFQPLKPFVYGQIEKPAMDRGRRDIATPLSKLKVPVQFKNSEYLLIMADAILQNENTGKPNLLRAIYEVMEESAEGDNTARGIDTIQFESTCKSGLMAPIDIKQYYNKEGGEAMAKIALREAIYNEDGSYNTDTYVYEVPFENYAIQQEVPEHFKNHLQAHGSQIRYIIPSDLESVDSEGNTVTYDYFDRGERKQLTAEEYKQEYEKNISENIEASLEELSKQLGIGNEFLSRKDRNIALSQVLIKEIYDSPRYGVELLTACAVNEETGEFNIPLGDPIQSKRIEQLINSIIKNRINKQEIAGGPVVQVTNFGTSKELNIRFNSKNGGLLMTKAEFAKTAPQNGKSYDIDAAYRKYIEENQAGIAYYEVFAPIFANELFEKFADRNGNIDIETIEMINPDLLKMIGYRIPTEDKYSMAPLKIVGFLPREAGDGIMLPNDITLLTGSDFDVDKFYLMRKEIGIAMRMNQPESVTLDNFNTEALEFTKNHREKIRNYLRTQIPNRENIKLTEKEENDIRVKINNEIDYEITQENKRHEAALEQIEEDAEDALIAYDERVEAGETVEGQEEKAESKVEEGKQRQINRENKYHERQLAKYEVKRERRIDNTLERERNRKVNQVVEDFLNGDIFSKSGDEVFKALKKAYINYMFDYVEDTEGTTYRNNKIIDMSWAVLTHETTASKMLTPGGFEPQKRMGYLVSAYQNPAVDKTWEELNAITDIDELKTLCYTDKNLCFIDTHLNFYKQNSAAATALGMAAVQKIAHAVLESNGFRIDVNNALHLEDDEFFSIAGKDFGGIMEIDNKYNDEGALIGRTLGEFVAMFADAVKDPVANLMNINNTTMPIVTALIRFGMPFEKVALFISQPIIRRVLETYNSENVTNFVRLSDVINRQLKSIEKTFDIENNSVLTELNTVTEEELINSLRSQEVETVTNYKILKFFQYLDTLAQQLKSPTYATRFNSISNAVGPLIIDNLIMEHKAENGNFDNFYDVDGNKADINTILGMHPILGSFYKAVNIAKSLFYDMPTNSQNFRNMLASADADIQSILYGDRKTLSSLSDFYQSYLLIASGAIPLEATAENHHQGLKYYIDKFPSDFMKANAKTLFKGNPLIDAIKLDIQNDKAVLKIDTTGMSTQDKEKLGDGWADLYKSGERGKKLAEHLFYYNFWRTGIGFSPKSFMGLFPTRLKNQIKGYNEAFIVGSQNFARNVVGEVVLDQFIRNNADNNKLVPKIKIGKDGVLFEKKDNNYIFSGTNYEAVKNKPYLKFKQGNKDVLLKRVGDNNITNVATYIELSILGNNGEYFEASTNRTYTPIINTAEVKEQNNEGQIEETTNNQAQVSDVSTDIKSSIDTQSRRATKIRNKLVELFMMSGRTREAAEAKVAEFKAKSDMEKRAIKPQMKKFIENNLKKQGIETNESLVEEMYNNLC